MATTKQTKPTKRPRRIYYGPPGAETSMWWTVRVSPAKEDVTLEGSIDDLLSSTSHTTIGCAISLMGKREKSKFPHPVVIVAVTKSTMLVVDKKNASGQPNHAVEYYHDYSYLVGLNDLDDAERAKAIKVLSKDHPELLEQKFKFRAPGKKKWNSIGGANNPSPKPPTGRNTAVVHRGALERAVRSGLIGKAAAKQLADVAEAAGA